MKFFMHRILTSGIAMIILLPGLAVAQGQKSVRPDPFVSGTVREYRGGENTKTYRKDPFVSDRWNVYGPNNHAESNVRIRKDPFISDRWIEEKEGASQAETGD
jgi:hypothetical protein